jgi:hypothetical protein
MTFSASNFKSAARALVVAGTLGVIAFAAPAQAQSNASASFNLGNGVNFTVQANQPVAQTVQYQQRPGNNQRPGGYERDRGPGWGGPGSGGGQHWGGGRPGNGNHWGGGQYRPQVCLSDRDIHRQLREVGYDNVRLGREYRDVVDATGERRGWVYSMEIDRCSGRVSRVRELHPAHRQQRPGFGLQFHFSN